MKIICFLLLLFGNEGKQNKPDNIITEIKKAKRFFGSCITNRNKTNILISFENKRKQNTCKKLNKK